MEKLDSKFTGTIIKVKDGTTVPDDEYMVFLAKDNAFPDTLKFYLSKCIELGADDEQIMAVSRAILRVDEWRAAHPDLCHVPHAKGEKLMDMP